MTYLELKKMIATLPTSQLNSDVTVAVENSGISVEFFKVVDFVGENGSWPEDADERQEMFVEDADGVLDDNHPYLTVIQ